MPVAVTASPTATAGLVEPVNTNRPSLVRGSLSGAGSVSQKPRDEPKVRVAVTTPVTPLTFWSFSGESRVVPWMSWIFAGVPGSPGPVPPPVVSPAALVGVGSPTVKSAALSSVSARVVPRATDVALVGAAVGLPSRTVAAPNPTRSLTRVSAAQSAAVLQVSAVVPETRAIVPAVADIAIVPVASGAGRATVPPAPLPSATR